jgi:hypothetical protein
VELPCLATPWTPAFAGVTAGDISSPNRR